MAAQKATRIGCNKGKPRVWLQGKVLVEAGFVRGDRFDIQIIKGCLNIFANPDGKRTVSGKGDQPIIDIATADLLTIGPMGTVLAITQLPIPKALALTV